MPNLARQKLNAILVRVNNCLSGYLNKVNYKIIIANTLNEARHSMGDYHGMGFAEYKQNYSYIAVAASIDKRNESLTAYRIRNILNVKNDLNTLEEKLSQDLAPNNLVEAFENIKIILNNAIENNNKISIVFNKIHISSDQNQLAGMGFWSSLWHRTPCQSRATKALKEALKCIELGCTPGVTQTLNHSELKLN